jgi:hypothetical protein
MLVRCVQLVALIGTASLQQQADKVQSLTHSSVRPSVVGNFVTISPQVVHQIAISALAHRKHGCYLVRHTEKASRHSVTGIPDTRHHRRSTRVGGLCIDII